jgi:hypothetical protein
MIQMYRQVKSCMKNLVDLNLRKAKQYFNYVL